MIETELKARIHRIEAPVRRYLYLVTPEGEWLGSSDGKTTASQAFVDDNALWEAQRAGFRHLATGLSLPAGGAFTVVRGPEKRPSESLTFLKAHGWVALAQILADDVVDGLQRLGGVDAYEDAEDPGAGPLRTRHIGADPALARATCEPVSLWLCRQYMRVEDIKLGHPPQVTALTPDDGERPVQGWHADFPYMWGSDRSPAGYRAPPGADDMVLGMQRNICVSDFRKENGATVFALASHGAYALPPEAWGRARATFQPGHRQSVGLPYGGEDTDVIEAPAGTIILYDARLWHRAGWNLTNRRRGAVIQAITPGFIIPFMPMGPAFEAYLASEVPQQLDARERRELERLMVHRITGPAGVFAVGVDEAQTARLNERGAAGY